VLEFLRVGLCTAACKLAPGCSASTSGASIGAFPGLRFLGSYCSLPRGVTLGGAVAWEITPRVRFTRSIGVLGQCIWLQKSVRGVWPREATSVAAGVGDGGLASGFGKPPRSETASGTRSSGDGWSVEGSAEDHLLAKGVSDRGKPSAFTG